MDNKELHKLIISKLKELYGDLNNLKTNNTTCNTKIFHEVGAIKAFHYWDIIKEELPLLECKLRNGNYILATTKALYSKYNGEKYEMKYLEFKKSDKNFFSKNIQIGEGYTRIFNYILNNGDNFMYEIDSLYPADIIHNRLVMSMRFNKYNL